MKMAIEVDVPDHRYLRHLMKRGSFGALWPLYTRAQDPAKEFTESYSALSKLKEITRLDGLRVLHVGDGAHARTGALFAFMTKTHNTSVDPQTNLAVVHAWQSRYGVERFEAVKARWEDVPELEADIVTLVHAHVDTAALLQRVKGWKLAYTLACCRPHEQLTEAYPAVSAGEDMCVLSPQRKYQVLRNPEAA